MEWSVNADREMLEQSLVLALLVKGRTVIDDFKKTSELMRFADALREFGLESREVGNQLVLEGIGFMYKLPAILPSDFSLNAQVLIWALASKDRDSRFTMFANSCTDFADRIALLKKLTGAVIEEETENSVSFHFPERVPSLKKGSFGGFPYLPRNYALLSALVDGRELSLEEKLSVRDQLSSMLVYFGANMKFEVHTPELKDELSRRLAKAKGMKLERTWRTLLGETKIMTSRDYYIPGDVTEALALIVASLFAATKDGELVKNVVVGGSRASAFSVLKRMGADFEVTGRRERYGEAYGDIAIKPLANKRLQGCHFAGDQMAIAVEEIPLLAVAACYAEKETIFHLPPEEVDAAKPLLECIAKNLRQTGAEIGVYEDGLVIRGREELDVGEFDCTGFPVVGLALSILAARVKVPVEIVGIEKTEEVFPGVRESIFKICGKEES